MMMNKNTLDGNGHAAGVPAVSGGAAAVPVASSMGDSVTPHALITGPRDYRYLMAGIDTLDLGVYVDWGATLAEIQPQLEYQREQSIEGKDLLWEHPAVGKAIVTGSNKRNYRYHLETSDLHFWLANSTTPNRFPNVYVSPKAESLWLKGPQQTVDGIVQLIEGLGGSILELQVSRCDLAADFVIPEGLSLDFLRSSRVSRTKDTHHYENDDGLQTFYVGTSGAPLQARIYNKLLQVTKNPKSAFFLAMWGGPIPVWRIEFQIRRQALRSIGVDSFDDLTRQAGGIWTYLTDKWLSFKLDDNINTSRRTVHPWWGSVQDCADMLGPACTIERAGLKVPTVPVDWYVSHMAGCLLPFAAYQGLPSIEGALEAFDEVARGYWAEKCWDDSYTRRRIQLGQSEEGGGCDVPF
jgi:hypothetical protein